MKTKRNSCDDSSDAIPDLDHPYTFSANRISTIMGCLWNTNSFLLSRRDSWISVSTAGTDFLAARGVGLGEARLFGETMAAGVATRSTLLVRVTGFLGVAESPRIATNAAALAPRRGRSGAGALSADFRAMITRKYGGNVD